MLPASKVTMSSGAVRVGIRRAEQAEPGQENGGISGISNGSSPNEATMRWERRLGGAQGMRERQHGAERIGRPGRTWAGQAHLVRGVQEGPAPGACWLGQVQSRW